jgi:hypothetical protein
MALTDNLQAFYKLSDLTDSSGNNRTLTNNGNVSFASGKIGNAAVFDGSNWLNASVSQTPSTVSCWVKSSNFDGYKNLIALRDNDNNIGFLIQGQSGNNFRFYSNESNISSNATVADDSWHNIVVTVSNGSVNIYVDGLLDVNSSGGSAGITTTKIGIGSYDDGSYDHLNGQIDAVGIWNRALSDAEVAELYNNGTGLELDPPNYRGEWDNFTDYGQDDVVSISGVYWKLTGLGGWTVGGAPGLGYGWTLLVQAPVGGKVSLSGRISLSGRVKFAV